LTLSKPAVCSNGSGPAATCDRTTKAKGRDCGGFSVTRSFLASGSNRQSATSEEAGLFVALAGMIRSASRTSVIVAPAGTSKVSSLNSPWAGRTCTVVHALYDTRRGRKELKQLCEEHGFLPFHIAAARLPADP
jgi:hypothetical protein